MQYKIVVNGDIEAIFIQVAIRSEDQDALRFLWKKDGEERNFQVQETNIWCKLFPFMCNIHHRFAEDNKLSNPEAYLAIRNSFYRDDYLQGFNTTVKAAITTKEVKDTLHKGGFKLKNFFSKNPNKVMKITGENADTVKEQRTLR